MASVSEVINAHIRAAISDLHTAIPARVLSFNPLTGTVDVAAAIDQTLSDGSVLSRGPIRQVPVQFASSPRTLISFPIKAGDTGQLIFQERSTDEWLAQSSAAEGGSNVSAVDRRMHDYNDCVFIPGIYPHSKSPVSGNGHTLAHNPDSDLTIKHNIGTGAETRISIEGSGSIVMENSLGKIRLNNDGSVTLDCIKVTINSSGNVDINASDLNISATNILTTGVLKNNGKLVGSTHTHAGVTPGVGNTGVPN